MKSQNSKVAFLKTILDVSASMEGYDRMSTRGLKIVLNDLGQGLHPLSGSASLLFLPARRYASAGYRDRNVSVRLSRAGIVSKRRKLTA